MSDVLSIRDFDSLEFVDRLAGIWLHCQSLFRRASNLAEQTEQRVQGMRRHTFNGLAEIGEALLRVQESRPGEFADWFAAHQTRLGFSLSHADRCKAAARLVREHGPEQAFALSLARQTAQANPPLLSDTLRLTRPVAELTREERDRWRQRLKPWVDTYREIEQLDGNST